FYVIEKIAHQLDRPAFLLSFGGENGSKSRAVLCRTGGCDISKRISVLLEPLFDATAVLRMHRLVIAEPLCDEAVALRETESAVAPQACEEQPVVGVVNPIGAFAVFACVTRLTFRG